MTSSAWNQVRPDTISKCFNKSWGNAQSREPTTEIDEDDIPLSVLRDRLQLDPTLTFADYLNVDSELATSETESEASIMAALHGKDDGGVDEESDGEDPDEAPGVSAASQIPISTSEALQKVRDLQLYFSQLENVTDTSFSHLSSLEAYLLKKSVSFQQPTIMQFFSRV